ncbi:MTH938/NDUFAF3 family protein [Sphingomonas cannabina]|uniref:Mth938-like domain-containing protein n=1 Tax=Sphingomonas cannabina TaxID=2899123 RepID=UPI001F33D432|nr:Mth938-like domain-containing protein [Sphingomonas cannabina]UIJ45041.1 MTH938/NDUFAF3 family protein [Sphingomonas cannabina]
MRMDRNAVASGPVIAGFSHGGFRIDDNVYRALLITPERADGWEPPALEALGEADVASVLALDPVPEFLLLGTGATLVRPSPAFTAALEARGIGVEAMDSRAAARAWGVLRAEGRWIVGALYSLDQESK